MVFDLSDLARLGKRLLPSLWITGNGLAVPKVKHRHAKRARVIFL